MTNRDSMGDNIGMALSTAAADAVERAGAVTVLVNARKRLPLSGLLIAADQVLTASHGVERENDIQVILPDGSEASAVLAGRDRGTDLAVLRLSSAVNFPAADLSSQEPRVGSLVVAVGRPSSEGIQASFGMVNALGSGLRTHHGGMVERYLITDAVPYPGFSGGPLVDLGGSLLGINTSGLVRGASLVIPSGVALRAAQNLIEHGHVKRGYLGIRSQVVEIPTQAANSLGRGQSTGLLVVGVESEGPAAAGLMVGDILVGLNGRPVNDHEELLNGLAGEAGKTVELQALRGGQLQTVRVQVGERE